MAKKGKTLTNKITGEKITWMETSADTNGSHILFNFEVAPKGYVPVRHIHTSQNEHFEILSGSLRIELNGETKNLKAGDKIIVPQGQPHQWWNDSADAAVKAKIRFEPALKTEIFFEQFFGLANDGKTKIDGSPKFMQIMAMSNEYDIYISGPPVLLQKIMSFVLGSIARLSGFKKYYKKYDDY
ncbi:MAG: cupin domain-containing protein [Bacteroidota bacterium]